MDTETGPRLVWTTSPPPERELKKSGFDVRQFGKLRHRYIESAITQSANRSSVQNAAQDLLAIFDASPRVAVLGVPARTAGDIGILYAYLVEPAFRRNRTLFLGVDQRLEELKPWELAEPVIGYPWSFERLVFLADRYLRTERDGLPPLTPIESRLLSAMREAGLSPSSQHGIGPYRVDFAFTEQRVIVEADGRRWHDADRDAARDKHLRSLGWEVLRYWGSDIHRDAAGIADRIATILDSRNSLATYSELLSEMESRSWWQRLLDWLLRRDPIPEATVPIPAESRLRPTTAWQRGLDHDQRRAVDAHDGVVQVIAPAGSGKTATIIARVQELLARGVPSGRILCSTFNRATREELEERLTKVGVDGVIVRNFHALGRMILEAEGLLRREIGPASYGQWRRLARQAMETVEDGVWLDAPLASELVSNYKLAEMCNPESAARRASDPREATAAEIYRLYEQHLEEADRLDFDDLILKAVHLLQDDSATRERWQERWECILVDEYQDIEPAQELLIRLVAAPEDALFVVGDEDQCIYSWRRASVERIVNLDTVYPGLERILLQTSYRCPPAITAAAQQLIENNRRRFPKVIAPRPSSGSGQSIELLRVEGLSNGAKAVAEILGEATSPESIVVLARTSRLLREVVRACVEAHVPVRAPENAFRPTGAEETALAYLRAASAPLEASDEDIRQSFRVPNRYLPREAEADLVARLRHGIPPEEAVMGIAIAGEDEWRRPKIKEWGTLVSRIAASASAAAAVRLLRTSGGLDRHYSSVELMSPHDQVEVEALQDLEELGGDSSIADFVTTLEARASGLAIADDASAIELSTIHGAKGREWETVVLFGADANQMPHFRTLAQAGSEDEFANAVEDERRLAYVAMTRSKDRLMVVSTGEPSPFLRESALVTSAPPIPTKSEIDARIAEAGERKAKTPSEDARAGKRVQGLPSSALPTIKAKYQTRCPVCSGPISIGETIVRTNDNWVHQRCVTR